MTSTQNSRPSETQTAPVRQETAEKVEVVPSPQNEADTLSKPPATGRMVPSTETTGSVWLRYSVRQGGNGGCESSTQV